MMPDQSYQLWATERPKMTAEQRADDARRGEFAAAMSRSFASVGRQMRTLAFPRPRPRRSITAESGQEWRSSAVHAVSLRR
jgi:hypothetical protein